MYTNDDGSENSILFSKQAALESQLSISQDDQQAADLRCNEMRLAVTEALSSRDLAQVGLQHMSQGFIMYMLSADVTLSGLLGSITHSIHESCF